MVILSNPVGVMASGQPKRLTLAGPCMVTNFGTPAGVRQTKETGGTCMYKYNTFGYCDIYKYQLFVELQLLSAMYYVIV